MTEITVDQSRARAQGDNVGRDKTTYHYRPSKIDQLIFKLRQEQENDTRTEGMIDSLQYYLTRISPDGVVGLEAKLAKSDRLDQRSKALREKELFAKFLERWSHFASAQEFFAYVLANIEQRFNSYPYSQLATLTRAEFDGLVHEKVIMPVMAEIGDEPLGITPTVICGMIYWLAEQCFIRWHS